MARTRTLTDEQILERVGTALSNSGATWTLAGAAADAGLHPATLIKRFGSRHALLVALSRRWIDGIPRAPVTDDAHQELLAWAESLSPGDATAGQVLARVDMLIEDLRDPELRALLDQGWQRHLRYLAALIARSRRAGRISSALSPETIAHLLLDLAHGSLLRAAVSIDPSEADPGDAVRTLLLAME